MIVPIARAILKNFVRSRTALVVLFVLPLVLISLLFTSFNPDGMRQLPAGVVIHSGLSISDVDQSLSFLKFTEYWNLSDCLRDLRLHERYACADVHKTDRVVVDLYYDNTQDPIIWEVVQKSDLAVRELAKHQAFLVADKLVSSLDPIDSSLGNMSVRTSSTISDVASFRSDLDTARTQLAQSATQLNTELNGMDSDIADARSSASQMHDAKNAGVSNARSSISDLRMLVFQIESTTNDSATRAALSQADARINDVSSSIDRVDSDTETYYADTTAKLDSYAQKSAQGHQVASQMQGYAIKLQGVSSQVGQMSNDLVSSKKQLDTLQQNVRSFKDFNRNALIDPVVLTSDPVYVPHGFFDTNTTAQDTIRGFNLLSYQTLFPNLLMLVVLFFSVLVSAFMTLSHLDTPAHVRIRIVRGSSLSDFVAIWLSSTIIASASIFIVYALGLVVFQIGFTAGSLAFALLVLIIELVTSLLGIGIVYAMRTEAMSLILSMFAVVGLLFGSGFILPIERMSDWAFALSHINPIWIGLDAFDRMIFYNAPITSFGWAYAVLLGWFVVLGALVFAVKRWRRL